MPPFEDDRWLALTMLALGFLTVYAAVEFEPVIPLLGLLVVLVAVLPLVGIAPGRTLAAASLMSGVTLLEPLLPASQRLAPDLERGLYLAAGFLLIILSAPRLRPTPRSP